MTLAEMEREAIERALAEHGGNRTHAALALGISLRTLRRRLRRMAQVGHSGPSADSRHGDNIGYGQGSA